MAEADAPAGGQHASTEDLANRLFKNDKLGIGTVVRDLVARTKQTQGQAVNGNGNTPGVQNDLFVIGGAESTFVTQAGLTRVVVDPGPDAKPASMPQSEPEENLKLEDSEEPERAKAPPPRLSVGDAAQAASAGKHRGCRGCWASLHDTLTVSYSLSNTSKVRGQVKRVRECDVIIGFSSLHL